MNFVGFLEVFAGAADLPSLERPPQPMPRPCGHRFWAGCLIASSLISLPTAAQYLRHEVTSLPPLLKLAIARGEARGVLVGAAADAMAERFGSREPIEVDVKTVQSLKDPMCKRLEVTTRQGSVQITSKHGKVSPKKSEQLVYQVNFCSDGNFPENR